MILFLLFQSLLLCFLMPPLSFFFVLLGFLSSFSLGFCFYQSSNYLIFNFNIFSFLDSLFLFFGLFILSSLSHSASTLYYSSSIFFISYSIELMSSHGLEVNPTSLLVTSSLGESSTVTTSNSSSTFFHSSSTI